MIIQIPPIDLDVDSIISKLSYVSAAITECRTQLAGKIPLIGFSGLPFTLLAYMIEGESSKVFSKARKQYYKNHEKFMSLVAFLESCIIRYVDEQIKAGAQLIQLFESHSDFVSVDMVEDLGNPIIRIAEEIKKQHPDIPITVYAKNANTSMIQLLSRSKYVDTFGVDWGLTGQQARSLYGENFTLQGNLNPSALHSSPDKLENLTNKMISSFVTDRENPRYIANLGHGIYPDSPIESVEKFIETIHSFKL